MTQRAFYALPATVQELYFRGDSACWERELLNGLRDEPSRQGPRGRVTFDISVPMTANLKKHILRLPDLETLSGGHGDAGRVRRPAELLAGRGRSSGGSRAVALHRHRQAQAAGRVCSPPAAT